MRLVAMLATRAIGLASGVPVLVWPLLAAVAWAGAAQWQTHSLRTELAELRASVAEERAAAARTAAAERDGRKQVAAAAATEYEAKRAAQERTHAQTLSNLRRALGAPISCPAGASASVGDVLVPADAVDGLRRAGADGAGGN